MTAAGRQRALLGIVAALLVVIAVLAWKFIVAGSTLPGDDGRTIVVLEPGERALMLREMRGFVDGVQRIADALARDDRQAVAAASRELGTVKAHDVPAAMLGKLPLEFKQLAFGVHRGFDAIAQDTAAAPQQTLRQLADVMRNCTACHERYRLGTEAAR
jgi:hypothetical protein